MGITDIIRVNQTAITRSATLTAEITGYCLSKEWKEGECLVTSANCF